MVTGSDHIVAATAARIFADLANPQTVNKARSTDWKTGLWRAAGEAGLTLAWVPEALGGAGASLAEGFEIVAAAGRNGLSVPLVETMIAGWLLAQAGLEAPEGGHAAITVAPARPRDKLTFNADGTLSGNAGGVPFAKETQYLAVMASDRESASKGDVIALVKSADCRIVEGRSLAGDGNDRVTFERAKVVRWGRPQNPWSLTHLMLMGATARSLQMAGALEAILTMSVGYANERVAFERKIGKFQAVQQNLARLAGETAASLAAAGSAADTIARDGIGGDAVWLEAASAKIRSGEAAAEGSAIAHQVHGAIGFTNEHLLHRFTLRLLSWRDDFGSESHWAAALGGIVAGRGADQFWPMLAAR